MAGHHMVMMLMQLYAFKIVSWIHDPCISVTVNSRGDVKDSGLKT